MLKMRRLISFDLLTVAKFWSYYCCFWQDFSVIFWSYKYKLSIYSIDHLFLLFFTSPAQNHKITKYIYVSYSIYVFKSFNIQLLYYKISPNKEIT